MQDLQSALEVLQHGGVIIYPLLALALIALVVMLDKALIYHRHARVPASIRKLVGTYGFDWTELDRQLEDLGPRHYFGRFFRVIMDNRAEPPWWVESRAGDEARQIEKALDQGMWVLDTTVTAAPLLGLLGTLFGMMQSFKLIGPGGLLHQGGVTAGVAEALIATALGLFIALVALFGFNYLARLQARTLDEMEHLGTRLMDHIRLDHPRQAARDGDPS
ncbi:MAG TPA: MotA/TolQ/ExbB proton channel family protein [Thiobacillaceae bacterium]|nr:MotA/TolQ/ExbB proton channel family protein [Thiobacillaceae bacterium]HNU64460.1 MotA/TolQ/ExbB proton channel family protein [Thiobacillaceae bacterium]